MCTSAIFSGNRPFLPLLSRQTVIWHRSNNLTFSFVIPLNKKWKVIGFERKRNGISLTFIPKDQQAPHNTEMIMAKIMSSLMVTVDEYFKGMTKSYGSFIFTKLETTSSSDTLLIKSKWKDDKKTGKEVQAIIKKDQTIFVLKYQTIQEKDTQKCEYYLPMLRDIIVRSNED